MKVPKSILQHSDKYTDGGDAWTQYTPEELAQWVILLTKRATHRVDPEKAAKDMQDARNYLAMFEAWVDSKCLRLGVDSMEGGQ